jgi:hypothetical protein
MRCAAFGGLAYKKPQSGYALCAVFLRHIFLRPETAARFLYRAQKNVPEKNRTKGRSPDCGFSPAHFARRWNCYAIPLSRRSKRRIQPERYMQWGLNWLINIKFTGKILDKNETVPLGADRKSVV